INRSFSLVMGFLLLLFSATVALNCEHLVQEQVRENRKLREAIEGPAQLLQGCTYEAMPDLGFSQAEISQFSKQDARLAIWVIINQLFQIFHDNSDHGQKNPGATEHVLMVFHQQSNRWQKCSVIETRKKAPFANPNIEQRLEEYFSKLRTFLRNKQYSPCSWENVRLELRICSFSSTSLRQGSSSLIPV
uniref:Uncharacterized protein n=1 Tax=Salvator merianae TaxID=96440 RepID=A0A8D0DJ34_SALMN